VRTVDKLPIRNNSK